VGLYYLPSSGVNEHAWSSAPKNYVALLCETSSLSEARSAAARLFGRELQQPNATVGFSGAGFTGCGKTQNAVILSEAKNLSLFVL
jgi:hypothetical protein